jgi:hypothetical protein
MYSRDHILRVSNKIVSTLSSSVRFQKNFCSSHQLTTIIIVVSLLLLSSTTAVTQEHQKTALAQAKTITKDDNNNFVTYENPTYGIRMQYLSDWEKIEFNQIGSSLNLVVIFRSSPENSSDTKLENLVIEVGNLPFKNIPLEKVIKANINNLKKSLIDFELNESTTITIAGGNLAHKMVYTYRDKEDNGQAKIMQILMIKSDKAYLITYAAEQRRYDSYLPIIQNMIDSLRIKIHDDNAFTV